MRVHVGNIDVGFRCDVKRGSSGTVIRPESACPLNGIGREENQDGVLSFTAGQAF